MKILRVSEVIILIFLISQFLLSSIHPFVSLLLLQQTGTQGGLLHQTWVSTPLNDEDGDVLKRF